MHGIEFGAPEWEMWGVPPKQEGPWGVQMDAPCVSREGSSHLREELLPAQKPRKGPGEQGLEYLMP